MVDIAREERIEKWDRFLDQFQEFHYSDEVAVLYSSNSMLKAEIDKLFGDIGLA